MTNPRILALDVIAEVNDNDAYSNLVLPGAIREARLDSRDAALATDLTYGSLRWQGFLDAVLEHCVSSGVARIDLDVLEVLRVGAYELVIRGAAAHVVNEWVNIAKRRVRRASGLVNAVLRRASERSLDEWRTVLSTNLEGDAFTAAVTSHPTWIVQEFDALLGDECDAALDANNVAPAPTFIALPGLAERPSDSTPTRFSPFGFRTGPGDPSLVDGVSSGSVRVQDEGSQLAALLLTAASPIRSGEHWLDLCAGPGGKTALLAAVGLPAGATLIANEVHPHRATLVRKALAPFGTTVAVTEGDGRTIGVAERKSFDRILVDAPCSGLGALRRRPESRWRKSPDDLTELVPLQRSLLDSAIDALTPGGTVAYVTCSPVAAETVGVVDAVVDARDDVECIDTPAVLREIAPTITGAGLGTAVQLWPHRHGTDAMFIQLIRRTR
jgi:16S rRNA (cytosine967-C5)-methyltransferase